MADLEVVLARLHRAVEQLDVQPAAPAVAAPVSVAVVAMPAPQHRWLFTVGRDSEGRVATIVAEPLA